MMENLLTAKGGFLEMQTKSYFWKTVVVSFRKITLKSFLGTQELVS